MEPILGTIALFGFNFAPRGWAFCQGQLLPIAQNTALFSLLGTMYGGNGVTTFALPDLRGRAPIGQGQGPGLSNYTIGQQAGTENVTILSGQMPIHTHTLNGSGNPATSNSLSGNVPAQPNGIVTNSEESVAVNEYASAGNPVMADPSAIGVAGGNQPLPIMQPYLAMNYCIAIEGVFPSRN